VESDLLSEEKFLYYLKTYTLGGSPHKWGDAKRKLLADHRTRVRIMQEDLYAVEDTRQMLELLRQAAPHTPPELKTLIETQLMSWEDI
jgi:hypothetical protein